MLPFQENWLLRGNKLIFLLTVWLLVMCNQTGKAGDTVDVVLSQSGMIDVCGDKSDKDIIILISVGRVQQTDSLFGFNFEIKYDSVKFKFHSPVYLNTLAEFFEIKDVNFGKKGLVRGYASVGLLGRQISGNRPLIGIYGDYIDNCPGSSEISLNYIEFTDEFQKVIRSYVPTTVYATEVYKPTRFLHTDFLLDSIVDLRKDSIINVRVNFVTGSQLKLDTGEFEIYFDNSNLIYLKNIKLSNDLELISESSEDHSKYQIEVKFNNLKDQYMDLRLIVKENKTDSCKIKIVPISTNYCSCVKKLDGDSIMIKSKEIIDTSTVVWEKESDRSTLMNYYDYVSESFVIDLNDYMDGVIKVYDICGSMIIEKNFGWSKKISIDGKYLNKGIYLAIINNDLKINKIILIKN